MRSVFPLGLAFGAACLTWASQFAIPHAPRAAAEPPIRVAAARCFAPGTPFAKIEEMGEMLPPVSSDIRFSTSNHWAATATDGGGLTQGNPITLTWGIIPDGTIIPGFGAGRRGPSDLRARLNALYGDEATWIELFQRVFDRWSEVTGVTYVHEPNDDGITLSNDADFGPGQLHVRPDVRIGGRPIDGDFDTLAFNFFPPIGDMVIDTDDRFFDDTGQDSLKLRNTIAHELGHGLGLEHVCPVEGTKLMEPFASTKFDGPQYDDILKAQRHHGDASEPNDSPLAASSLGTLEALPLTVDALSLDGIGDADFFEFDTGSEEIQVAVEITPVGDTYLLGPHTTSCDNATPFVSRNQRNLRLEVTDVTGRVLGASDSQTSGSGEGVYFWSHPTQGPYFIGVFGDPVDTAQSYTLSVSRVQTENDLAVSVSASTSKFVPGSRQTIEVNLKNSGPEEATHVSVEVALPAPLHVESVYWGQGEEGQIESNAHHVSAGLGGLSGQSGTTLFIDVIPTGPGVSKVSATISRAEIDPILTNNVATLEFAILSGDPLHVEDFNAFPGVSGRPGNAVPNDTTGFFDLRYDYPTTTTAGFALDTSLAQNGRGLTFLATEDNAMETTTDFPAASYRDRRHQLALWFRYSDVSGSPDDSLTQALFVYNRSAANLAYHLQCGKDSAGIEGAGVAIPTGNELVAAPSHIALAPNQWHSVVLQYTSASNKHSLDAGIRVWFNPESGEAQPDIEIPTLSGAMGAEFGDGPFGRYAFGAAAFPADSAGPHIWMDRIGAWDGHGVSGVNDLAAALQFLYAIVSVVPEETPLTVIEGDGGSDAGLLTVALTRTGDPGVAGSVEWTVVPSGANPVDEADFAGGAFPSGTASFAPHELAQTIEIPIAADLEAEGDETFEIQLSTSSRALRLVQSSISVSILDDDQSSDIEVTLDASANLVIRSLDAASHDALTLRANAGDAGYRIEGKSHTFRTAIASASGDGTKSVRVPFEQVSGTSVIVATRLGTDTLTLDFSGGHFPHPVLFHPDEVDAESDTLVLTGGASDEANFLYLGSGRGTVDLDGETRVSYDGVEQLTSELALARVRCTYGGLDDAITVEALDEGKTRVSAPNATVTSFLNPGSLLTIEAGDGNDRITLTSLTAGYASVLLDGQQGDDTIELPAELTLSPQANLTTKAESIFSPPNGTQLAADTWLVEGALAVEVESALAVAADLDFLPGSSLVFGVDGAAERSGVLRLLSGHAVDFGGASLRLELSGVAPAGSIFPLAEMSPDSVITAAFAELAEGGTVRAGNGIFAITYIGGDRGGDLVATALLDYSQWANSAFSGVPDGLVTHEPGGNADDDEWLNGLEYLLGLNPMQSENSTEDPFSVFVGESSAIISYPRRMLVPEGLEIVEWSLDLQEWHAAEGVTPVIESLGELRDRATWTVPFPQGVDQDQDERVFYRLRATIPVGE